MDSVPGQMAFDFDGPGKWCSLCKTHLSLDAFGNNRNGPLGLAFWCRACTRNKSAAWRAAHPEAKKARDQAYRNANREKIRAQVRAYYQENRGKLLEQAKAYAATHPEVRKASWARAKQERGDQIREANNAASRRRNHKRGTYVRDWHAAHPERIRAAKLKHYHTHRDKWRLRDVLHRGRKRGAGGKPTLQFIRDLHTLQGGVCSYCAAQLIEPYHLEHKTPLCRSGTNDPSNLCLSCAACNLRKGRKTDAEFRRLLPASSPAPGAPAPGGCPGS